MRTYYQLGGMAIYLSGAVGSMGPRSPEAPDAFERARHMGEELASLVVSAFGGDGFAPDGRPRPSSPLLWRLGVRYNTVMEYRMPLTAHLFRA